METSVQENTNIEDAFMQLIKDVYGNIENGRLSDVQTLSKGFRPISVENDQHSEQQQQDGCIMTRPGSGCNIS
jgi:hypothetical protein